MRPSDDLVREFHEAVGQDIASHPIVPDVELVRFRLRLIKEEFDEVEAELKKLLGKQDVHASLETLGALLKEMCDLRYVLDGTALAFGLPYEDAYREVHRSNMTKARNARAVGGKLDKVPKGDYTPADMTKFIPPVIDAETV